MWSQISVGRPSIGGGSDVLDDEARCMMMARRQEGSSGGVACQKKWQIRLNHSNSASTSTAPRKSAFCFRLLSHNLLLSSSSPSPSPSITVVTMSIRFHKGPSIITLFHDPTSSTSRSILSLLSSYSNPAASPHKPTPSTDHGESCVIEANSPAPSDASEYLRSAASAPISLPIQLEVVDRKSNPPTPDQLRSIIDYLAEGTQPSSQDRKDRLAPHLSHAGKAQDGMPKLKDGPLVVNWDEGSAATSLQGVKEMLHRLEKEQTNDSHKDGSGCIIS